MGVLSCHSGQNSSEVSVFEPESQPFQTVIKKRLPKKGLDILSLFALKNSGTPDKTWTSGNMFKEQLLIKTILLSFLFVFPGFGKLTESARSADTVNHDPYAVLLKKYVKNGIVDYQGFKKEEGRLDTYLKRLENTDTASLSRNDQFAFYINAYNAWTIRLILNGYPGIRSIKEMGSFLKSPWKKKICRINGDVITLDDIEHNILRPTFKDPRVHFAINCASKGCPPLISEPYRGHTLEQQLNESARAFINDPGKNRLEGNTLYVSKIFKWFSKDFDGDIIGFFLKHAAKDLKKKLAIQGGNIKIRYLDYDWSLNGR